MRSAYAIAAISALAAAQDNLDCKAFKTFVLEAFDCDPDFFNCKSKDGATDEMTLESERSVSDGGEKFIAAGCISRIIFPDEECVCCRRNLPADSDLTDSAIARRHLCLGPEF